MHAIALSALTVPSVFEPTYGELTDIFICTHFDPKEGLEMVRTVPCDKVEVIELDGKELCIVSKNIPDGPRIGQVICRNEWLEEQLELDGEIYMVYDDLPDYIASCGHAKNRYRFVEVKRFTTMGRIAKSLISEAFAGRTKASTALEAEAFVLNRPVIMDDDVAEAYDTLHLMVSDDQSGLRKKNPRRKGLMYGKVMDLAEDQLTHVAEMTVQIERHCYIATCQMDEIIGALASLRQVLESRLNSAADPARYEAYAEELLEWSDKIGKIVARPSARVVAYLCRELDTAADLYQHKQADQAAIMLNRSKCVLAFLTEIFVKMFHLRLGLLPYADRQAILPDRARLEFVMDIDEIYRLADHYGILREGGPSPISLDAVLEGATIVSPLRNHLREARTHVRDGFSVLAYEEIKAWLKRS